MKRTVCPYCGQILYGKVRQCPYCMAPLQEVPYEKKKRKIVVGICVTIGMLLLGCNIGLGVWLCRNYNSSEGDVDSAALSHENGYQLESSASPEPTKGLSSEEIQGIARNAIDSYNKGKLSYEEAKKKLVDLHEEYKSKLEGYDTMMLVLSKLRSSKESFNNGALLEESKQYEEAIEEYGKVISEDEKYKDATTAKHRVEKELKEQQEQKTKKFELTKGKVIQTDAIKATFLGASFTNAIKPDNTKKSYRYYRIKDSKNIWLDLKFKIENHGKEDFDLSTMISDIQVYRKESRFSCVFGAYASSGNSLDFVGMKGTLKPGKSVTYHLIAEMPKELKKSKDSLEIKLYLDGEKQVLHYR